jgi:dTMP kinase
MIFILLQGAAIGGRQALFITFEGIEGCGKTTQIKLLAQALKKAGIPFILTYEPGGTRIGKKIRDVLLNARNRDLDPLAELLLYVADRSQHITEVIQPALAKGQWVLCDRFSDATVAYQGKARGQDLKLIRLLNHKAQAGIEPDLTFILDCPVKTGLSRAVKRNQASAVKGQDRFEREKLAFHEKVRQAYLELARQKPKRFVVVDGKQSVARIERIIRNSLRPWLKT